ncbi:MAG TPA: response regulator, partial [Desulfuromonadales bacterium]|nr:response regulator [Desulfuromonadales bacterium]
MNLVMVGDEQTEQRIESQSILIVDDEPLIRDLCIQALKTYRILEADNGKDALDILEREPVDMILTDVMMPRLDGLDLLKTAKELRPNLVVVMMTGYAEKELILKALKADADDFITKPINLLQLRTTIERAWEKKKLKEELIQLKRMDRLKSDFLGLISHKLKTPVTSISLFMQNLSRGIDDPDNPEFRQTLNLILEETDYLEYLIQDLLHYSEIIIRDGGLNFSPILTKDLLTEIISALREEVQKKRLELNVHLADDLPTLKLDKQRINFALRALLSNAIKFTPEEGTVTVTACPTGGHFEVKVEDTGPGIAREEMPKVFEEFYQVDPDHTGQVRGFGLGLY